MRTDTERIDQYAAMLMRLGNWPQDVRWAKVNVHGHAAECVVECHEALPSDSHKDEAGNRKRAFVSTDRRVTHFVVKSYREAMDLALDFYGGMSIEEIRAGIAVGAPEER